MMSSSALKWFSKRQLKWICFAFVLVSAAALLLLFWGFPPQQVNQISQTRIGGDAEAEEDDRYWDTGAGNADEPSSGG